MALISFIGLLFAGTGWVSGAMISCNWDHLLLLLHELALLWLLLQRNNVYLIRGCWFPLAFYFVRHTVRFISMGTEVDRISRRVVWFWLQECIFAYVVCRSLDLRMWSCKLQLCQQSRFVPSTCCVACYAGNKVYGVMEVTNLIPTFFFDKRIKWDKLSIVYEISTRLLI